ncbi:DUF3750 domain-containing protein [Roseiconus lacunae]|uniref:DUF3750 domain-containing protein n=1 Tax=Roseiconus lacunae TaxID=2605694 RepID=A0ABT7PRK0_9BACT|nr:DUF3750 domain-containing protein [Roseiconus lacunae]MDM4018904.1 DUF3750 domain-containing protein [Roseiconus lacunae]
MASARKFSVQLWAGRLPRVVRFAEHCWLVICDGDRTDRWEVWQYPNQSPQSWGHLHRNMLPAFGWIRDSRRYFLHEFVDKDAEAIAERLVSSPKEYPWCDRYHYVPGPNSNTYIQWCLQDRYRLGVRAIGRGFARW